MNASPRPLVIETVQRRGPRLVEPPTAPLPPAVLSALAAIVHDMRDVPRDCLRDPAELFIWLRRMAGRVEGVGRMRVPASPQPQVRRPLAGRPDSPRVLTVHERAEAVFASPSKTCVARGLEAETPRAASAPTCGKSLQVLRRPTTRTVTSRKGRAVKVETRRSLSAHQIEMFP